LCERPAQLLGLFHKKGSLEEGKQADIVIFDPNASYHVDESQIHNRYQSVCIYKGRELRG